MWRTPNAWFGAAWADGHGAVLAVRGFGFLCLLLPFFSLVVGRVKVLVVMNTVYTSQISSHHSITSWLKNILLDVLPFARSQTT